MFMFKTVPFVVVKPLFEVWTLLDRCSVCAIAHPELSQVKTKKSMSLPRLCSQIADGGNHHYKAFVLVIGSEI